MPNKKKSFRPKAKTKRGARALKAIEHISDDLKADKKLELELSKVKKDIEAMDIHIHDHSISA